MDAKSVSPLTYIFNSGVLTPGQAARDWNMLTESEKTQMKEYAEKEMVASGIPVLGAAVPA